MNRMTPRVYDPVPKLLRMQSEKDNRMQAYQRMSEQERRKAEDAKAELTASYFAFGVTLLILGAAVVGIVKTGGL